MKTKKFLLASAFLAAVTFTPGFSQANLGAACGCPPVAGRTTVDFATLADGSQNLTATNTVLTCDKTYILSQKYYVGNGKSITIAPGTVIKGEPETTPGVSRDGGVLIVSRGAKIIAAGTETCPIVFTTTLDVNVDGTYGISNKGKWGGVILLGTATNNLTTANALSAAGVNGVGFIEGFLSSEPRIYFGAGDPAFPTVDDNDNSGIMTYCSIRHGGEVVGAANEINGLTLGSVGRGTTLHHIEVVSNLDDGIEFFGGTVDLKYSSVLFNDDDGFDWDLNWSGRGQFWVVVKTDQGTASGGDNGFESDGDDNKINAANQSNPLVYNATFIGSNNINGNLTQKGIGVQCKEQTKGSIRNSIIANYKTGFNLFNDAGRPGDDAYDNWLANTLKVECNTFVGNTSAFQVTDQAAGTTATVVTTVTSGPNFDKFTLTDKNIIAASLNGFDFMHTMNVSTNVVSDVNDLIPNNPESNISVTGCPVYPVDGFFNSTTYRGAFEPGKKSWLSNYTYNSLLDLQDNLIPCSTDLNTDGLTNTSDFLILLGSIGTSCD